MNVWVCLKADCQLVQKRTNQWKRVCFWGWNSQFFHAALANVVKVKLTWWMLKWYSTHILFYLSIYKSVNVALKGGCEIAQWLWSASIYSEFQLKPIYTEETWIKTTQAGGRGDQNTLVRQYFLLILKTCYRNYFPHSYNVLFTH